MDQHLAVRLGIEAMACIQQLPAQIPIVINLPIEHEYQGFVLIVDRLTAGFQINDTQPPEGHSHAVVQVIALGIRASMSNHRRHLFENLVPVFNLTCKTAKTAHAHLSIFMVTPIVYQKIPAFKIPDRNYYGPPPPLQIEAA